MNTVLAVDDEQFNLELIEDYLADVDIKIVTASTGEEALKILEESPYKFITILLDRMMPGIDGMEVLSRIKADDRFSHIPVIMQTAKVSNDDVLEGLSAGAHYYITKPYDKETLVTIVDTAIRDYKHYIEISENLNQTVQALKLMTQGSFTFKSLDHARMLAAKLANVCPNPNEVVIGLTELMINAVEHGNLGITYEEKSQLTLGNEWENEVVKRLTLPEYKDKYIEVEFVRTKKEIKFVITDQGSGFDWKQYMCISPDRVFDTHGRGIAMANLISFDQIEYLGSGNKVCVTVPV